MLFGNSVGLTLHWDLLVPEAVRSKFSRFGLGSKFAGRSVFAAKVEVVGRYRLDY